MWREVKRLQGHTEVKGGSIREAGDLREGGASEEALNKSKVEIQGVERGSSGNGQTDKGRVGCCLNTYLVTRADVGSLMKT